MRITKTYPLKIGTVNIFFEGKEAKGADNLDCSLKNLENNLSNTDPWQAQKIIAKIRLILRDYNEEKLNIYVGTDHLLIIAKYVNKELVSFKQKEKIKKDVAFEISYKKGAIDCSLSGAGIDNFINPNTQDGQNQYELLSEYAKNITYSSLAAVNRISDLLLRVCDLYKIFYNENPNFQEEDILTKIQAMLYILSHYGLIDGFIFTDSSLKHDLFDHKFEAAYLPTSEEVTKIIENYTIPCTIPVNNETISIANQEKIATLGKLIREECANNVNKLVRLSIFLYLNSYSIDSITATNALKKNYLEDEIAEDQKLLARIGDKLDIY